MRRRTLVGIGAATAAVLTVGGVVALSGPGKPTAVTPAPPAAAESSCGLPGTPGTDGAAAATWANVAGWPLPVSATDGPGRRDTTGPWSCFARTESGAVLAGYVIAMRIGGLADDRPAVVREQTMPGPGQAVLLGSVPNPQDIVTPRGFDVAAYSPSSATIRYRLNTASGDFACTTDVSWSDGDWRLGVGDDGSTSSGCERGVPAEFVPWGP